MPPQAVVDVAAFGDGHDAGSAFVETVDGMKAVAGAEMMCQSIGNGTVPAAFGIAMDSHTGGLVQDQKILVLKQNIERGGNRREFPAGGIVPDFGGEHITRLHNDIGAGAFTVQQQTGFAQFDTRDQRFCHLQLPPQQGFHLPSGQFFCDG